MPGWIREWDGDGIITRSDDPRIAKAGLPTVGLYDRSEDRLRLPYTQPVAVLEEAVAALARVVADLQPDRRRARAAAPADVVV